MSTFFYFLLITVCVVSELGSRYKIADAERLELKRLIADAQCSRIQLADTLNKHKELEDAHMIQSKFIHKLQKKIGKVDKYIETIEMQEKVILKMQSVMKSTAPIRNKQQQLQNLNQNENQNLNQKDKENYQKNKKKSSSSDTESTANGNENQVEEFQNRINQLLEEVR